MENCRKIGLIGTLRETDVRLRAMEAIGCEVRTAAPEQCDELQGDAEITAVYVCAPVKQRAELCRNALRAGKHVLCQAPLAATEAEARSLLEEAKRAGRTLNVAHPSRRTQSALALREYVKGGSLGEIYYVRAQNVLHGENSLRAALLGVQKAEDGALLELGADVLDLALWLMGGDRISSVAAASYGEGSSAVAMLKLRSGAVIALESAWALHTCQVQPALITLCGALAGAVQNADGSWAVNMAHDGQLITQRPDVEPELMPSVREQAMQTMQCEFRHWLQCISSEVSATEEEATLCGVLEALSASAKNGRPEEL